MENKEKPKGRNPELRARARMALLDGKLTENRRENED